MASKAEKAAFKEGGKKGQDLAGMTDMGGMKYFTVVLETTEGDWNLHDQAMAGANVEVDSAAEERKGGAGDLGKVFMSASVEKLCMHFHVPKALQEVLPLKEWAEACLEGTYGKIIEESDEFVKAEAEQDKSKELFPLKMRDLAVNNSFALLRKKGLVQDDDDDDVDLGSLADAAGIEW